LITKTTSQINVKESLKNLEPYINFISNLSQFNLSSIQGIQSIDDEKYEDAAKFASSKIIEWAQQNYNILEKL